MNQIVGVCNDETGKVGLYVNGNEFISVGGSGLGTGSGPTANLCGYNGNQINIDGALVFGGGTQYPYYIDNVRVYKNALPVSLIEREYIAELPKFKSLAMSMR